MRRMFVALGAASLLFVSAGLASAQGPGGAGRRPGGFVGGRMGQMGGAGLGMLRIPEVQQELKMTQPQIAKLDGAMQAVQESMRELWQGGGNFQQMTQEEREKLLAKAEEIQMKAVAGILDQTQMVRYKQLALQQGGAMSLLRPSVGKELGITAEQRAKLQEVQREQMRALFQRGGQGGPGGQQMTPEERQQRMQQFREAQAKTQEAMMNVLTAQQKAKWTEMIGKPFKFPEPQFRAGRRGGNRPGGGPGGQPPL